MWNGYVVCPNLASSGEPPPPMLHTTTLTTADGAGDAYGPRCRVSVAVARWSRSTQMRYISPVIVVGLIGLMILTFDLLTSR